MYFMKKIFLSLFGLFIILIASAQVSVGINGNYTMYKQEFQQKTPGAGLRVYYDAAEKYGLSLGFTYGAPIKTPSVVTLENSSGSTQEVASEITYKFKTFNLNGNYNFIGNAGTTGKFYGSFGLGLVLVNYKEDIKESYDQNTYTPMDQIEGKENGFTINLGIGGEYKLGTPSIFGEAGIALPANKVGDTYVENYIPAHFVFNVGIKLPLGGGGN
jgi:hypothetical protein